MVDDSSDCPDRAAADAMKRLLTLQRNALRKLFDRPEFTPAEVSALGYRRLQQAEGIGQKGLQAIGAWLQSCGYELRLPESAAGDQKLHTRTRKHIEQAVRLLRTHGYSIHQSGEEGSN